MENLRKEALERFIPLVREETGKALQEECKKANPHKILEIGTAIGYSALLMLKVCCGDIYTLEKDEKRLKEAENNFIKYDVKHRVKTFLGDAIDTLKQFVEEGEKFDFIFLDGAKGQYIHYYPFLKQLLNIDGILFADNVKLLGLVGHQEKITHKNRTMTRNMTEFLRVINNDEDFSCQTFDIEDGYLIARKVR